MTLPYITLTYFVGLNYLGRFATEWFSFHSLILLPLQKTAFVRYIQNTVQLIIVPPLTQHAYFDIKKLNKASVVDLLPFISERPAISNILYHLTPAYSTSNKEARTRTPTLNSQEDELTEDIIKQDIQSSAINESDYILQKASNLCKYPTFNTLYETVIDNSNCGQFSPI